MNDFPRLRLEAQLEKMIEGAFAHLFGNTVRPHDVALALSRAMETGSETASSAPARRRLDAPDDYTIHLNPAVLEQLLASKPDLPQIMQTHIAGLAAGTGYHLANPPKIHFVADSQHDPGTITVDTDYQAAPRGGTAVMQPIRQALAPPAPLDAYLVMGGNGGETLALSGALINLGRSRDNHIVLEDAHVSRHHAQIRLRFGAYMLFDSNSQTGTWVNDVQIREHRLLMGDVIRIGKTQILYFQTDPLHDGQTHAQLPVDD